MAWFVCVWCGSGVCLSLCVACDGMCEVFDETVRPCVSGCWTDVCSLFASLKTDTFNWLTDGKTQFWWTLWLISVVRPSRDCKTHGHGFYIWDFQLSDHNCLFDWGLCSGLSYWTWQPPKWGWQCQLCLFICEYLCTQQWTKTTEFGLKHNQNTMLCSLE